MTELGARSELVASKACAELLRDSLSERLDRERMGENRALFEKFGTVLEKGGGHGSGE